jgi:hypothetical protein
VPVFVAGAVIAPRRELLYVLCWTVLAYSLLGHKEFRFIFPILPIAHIYAGYFLHRAYLWTRTTAAAASSTGESSVGRVSTTRKSRAGPANKAKKAPEGAEGRTRMTTTTMERRSMSMSMRRRKVLFWAGCALLLVSHTGMAYYFSFWHQRSPIDLMHYLRQETQRLDGGKPPPSVPSFTVCWPGYSSMVCGFLL